MDSTYAIPEGRCIHCERLLEEQPIHLLSCKYRLDATLTETERIMLCIVEKIAKMWQMREMLDDSDNMHDYDHGPGYMLWTAQEYQLLDRLSEYAVNEQDL